MSDEDHKKINKSEEEWKQSLTPEQYYVTRQHGTERAFSHPYHDEKAKGTYRCICCNTPLFASTTKYDSGTGWPSFFAPMNESAISEHEDRKLLRTRTEVRCAQCDAHLGHVFPDGPQPTGQRYCINGASLSLEKTQSDPLKPDDE